MIRPTVSPSPAESVASSETSETPSVSDDTSAVSNTSNRPRKVQPSKEAEKERPPWRAVSIAAPSKADKNAMLKAKILDATRRAILLQKIATISTQTDEVHTKLLRDNGVQTEERPVCDQNVATDETMLMIHDIPGGRLMFTQTVGHMTDAVLSTTTATQTARPRISLDFEKLYGYSDNEDEDEDKDSLDDAPVPESTVAMWSDLMDPFDDNASISDNVLDRFRSKSEIEKRVSNMHLYPVHAKRMPQLRTHQPRVDLIGNLIAESNALLGTFRRVSHALGPKLHATTTTKSRKPIEAAPLAPLQPLKWDGILNEACERLAEKLEKLK